MIKFSSTKLKTKMAELKISDIRKALLDYDRLASRLTRSVMSACDRIIGTSDIRFYLNRSGVKVVGTIGRYYVEDESIIVTKKKILKRLVLHGNIQWFPEDEYNDEIFRNGKGRIIKQEYNEGKKFAIIEILGDERVISHRVGDVVPGTNQLFIKLPKLRERCDGIYKLINGDDLIIKNIKCKLSLDEFDSWLNRDVDSDDYDAPYYTVRSNNDYSPDYIKLCKYLNERLGLNIDIEEYERRYDKNIQESDPIEGGL